MILDRHISSCGLKLASKWYADDDTFVTNSVEDMISLLDIVQQFKYVIRHSSQCRQM